MGAVAAAVVAAIGGLFALGVAPAILGVVAAGAGYAGAFLVGAVASAIGFVLLLAWSARSRASSVATLRT